MVLVITPGDRRAFKRCRRAWDFGSRLRRNWEPAEDVTEVDVGEAVRAALAVWYFPGMWEWERAIVRPLALEAYHRLVAVWPPGHEDLAAYGERLLDRYFDWAPSVDRFTPVRVETDFKVPVPDPADPARDLAGAGGSAVHFAGRIQLLVVDPFDAYWLVEHRVGPGWADADALVLDERGAACCWAWERFFLGMKMAGVVYNELRTDADLSREPAWLEAPGDVAEPPAAGHRRMYARSDHPPPPALAREGNHVFRRTRVTRGPVELERARHTLGLEAREMTGPALTVYPSPSWDVCGACRFRAPCVAMNTGVDAEEVLAAGYRQRAPYQEIEGRLGGVTWSMGRGAAPPKFRGPQPGP